MTVSLLGPLQQQASGAYGCCADGSCWWCRRPLWWTMRLNSSPGWARV